MTREEQIAQVLGEWRERTEKGEFVDPQAFLHDHPDMAADLRRHLAMHEVLALGRATATPPASRIGEYRIIREIGRGGMGVVYEAEQTSMRRKVALKVLFPSVTSSAKAVKRFQQEAWAAGRLKHTNIVAVHQLGEDRGTWFCAMELVEGRPLSDVIAELRRVRRSPRESGLAQAALGKAPAASGSGRTTGARAYHARIAEMFAEVADALQAAHDHGVIHRDVKPANLLLDAEGRLKLADFGLARLEEGSPSMTVTGEVLGTPLYMSPEQIAGGHAGVDHRTDIYSLGATLYEALTCRPPFRGDNVQQLASAIVRGVVVAPRRWDRRIPRDLETIVLKAMETEPARRYRTAGEMARDLRLFAEGGAIKARRIGLLGRMWRRAKRNKVRTALVAAAAVLAAIAGLAYVRAEREARARRALEYARLCGEAEEQRLAAALASDTSDTVAMRPKDRSEEIYKRAIALDPERYEAYFVFALHGARSAEQRLESLRQAEARGAPTRTIHMARALVHARSGQWDRAQAEEGLAALSVGGGAEESLFEGTIRLLGAEYDAAERLFTDAVCRAQPGSAAFFMALHNRGSLRMKRRDSAGALEDFLGLQAAGTRSIVIQVRIAALWERLSHPERAEAILRGLLEAARQSGTEETWVSLCEGLNAVGMYARTDEVSREVPGCDGWAHLLVTHAEALRKLNRLDDALAVLDRAIDIDPRNVAAHFDRGVLLCDHMERPAEALASFDRAVGIDPGLVEANSNRGVALIALGRGDDALAAVDRAIELDPSRATTHSTRGNVLMRLGRVEEALAAQDKAIALDPGFAEAHSRRGNALQTLGRLGEALAAQDRAVTLGPDLVLTHTNRAAVLGSLGRWDEALAECDHAIELQRSSAFAPTNRALALVHTNRGLALAHLDRLGEALAAFDRGVEADPSFAGGHEGRGTVLSKLNRLDEALKAHDHSIGLDPRLADARRNRAAVLRRLGRLDDAIAECRQAIGIDPSDAEAHRLLGVVLADARRFEDAVTAFDRALELAPSAEAYINRGEALYDMGRTDEALASYGRAIALAPSYARAHAGLAVLLELSGRLEEAVAAYDRAIETDPTCALTHRNRGNALVALGRQEEAIAAYRRAVELAPRDPATFNNLAWVLATCEDKRLRDADRAVALARQAVSLEPENARYWGTLGVALYRAGSFGDCGNALEKSMELSSGGGPMEWLVVAMALQRCGHRDRALEWYEKGRLWLLAQMSPQPNVEAWRHEAAELLGIGGASGQ